ncbi:hypothetical protein LINGRAHAP2_LOCUS36418 [Linum grandiflorum]
MGSYIPQDLATNILLRLSDGSAVARFRSVNKQWFSLLSDPKFLHRILWFDQHKDDNDEEDKKKKDSTNVLIQHHRAGRRRYIKYRNRLVYTLLSYDRQNERLIPIQPTNDHEEGLPKEYHNVELVPGINVRLQDSCYSRFSIVGYCDGIFCIYFEVRSAWSEIILWNPSTSETKILPIDSSNIPTDTGYIRFEQIGFGFDPKTKDHKVVKRGIYEHYDSAEPTLVTEIYSLRNDSWKQSQRIDYKIWSESHIRDLKTPTKHVVQSHNSGPNRRVYWHSHKAIASFDIVDEVFDRGHKFPAKLKRSMKDGDRTYRDPMCMQATSKEFMLSAIVGNHRGVYEIWSLMDYRRPESWTMLFVVSKFAVCDVVKSLGPLGSSPEGWYLFLKKDQELLAFDPETEEVKDISGIRVVPELEAPYFEVGSTYCYVPSKVSISRLNLHT